MIRIAVIGVGPRGLSALERIISHTRAPGPPVEVTLIEPGELGVGLHRLNQPDYLLLNTIAAQLTIFSDEQMTPGKPVTSGPSLLEWCRERNLPARFDDFLPRRLLAEYLRWAAGDLLRRVPDRLSVRHLSTRAVGLDYTADHARIALAGGTHLLADLALVTTGHGLIGAGSPTGAAANWVPGELIADPYPLPDQLDRIPGGATVALLGAGLTAMDVIASLTVGRGGRYRGDRYLPSGREPRIVLVTRSGLLPCARPATTSDRRPAPARHLTAEVIDRLRSTVPEGRLDFRRDVEPLVRREVLDRMAGASDAELAVVDRVLRPRDQRYPDYASFVATQLDTARFDLAEATKGLGRSLVKEGLECLRDHRGGLRAALDFPGLTEESQRYFITEYAALVNRAVIGPQKERIAELLLLIEAGVVLLGPGPKPELVRTAGDTDRAGWLVRSSCLDEPVEFAADVVVRANLSWPGGNSVQDLIAEALRGLARPGPAGGPYLALDRQGFPIPSADGGRRPPIAVFGPPAEGASYYNHYVPSPGVWSRILTDLDLVLEPVLAASPDPDPELAQDLPHVSVLTN